MKFLTSKQKESYDANGYIILDLFDDEQIDELSDEYDDIFKRKEKEDTEATWKGDWKKDNKKTEVKSIHNLQMHSSVFTRLLLNDKLLDSCEDVMQTSNVLLHHTKAHLKPPGTGSPFPMHQDYHYFPFENDSMIAVFVSLDASEPSNGGLCVYPGSHKLGPQQDVGSNTGWHYLDQEKFPLEKASPVNLKRGQVVIFSYLLIHGSYDNTSNRVRRMFLIQLMAADDLPLTQVHLSPCQQMVLRGICHNRDANIKKRHEEWIDQENKAKVSKIK